MKTFTSNKQIAYEARYWWLSLITGILFIITGFWVFRTPVESYLMLAVLFSVVFFVNGIIEIYTAISERKETDGWGWILAGGILDLIIGFILMTYPAISISILPFIVGFGLMFRSIMAIGISINMQIYEVKNWGWMLFFGIIGLLFSIFLLMNPVIAGLSIVVWTAMAFLVIGFYKIWLAFQLRQLKKDLQKSN